MTISQVPAGVDGNEQDLLPAFGLLTTPRCYSAVVVGCGAVSCTNRVVVVVGDDCVFARSSHCGVVLFAAFPYLHLVHWLVLLWCLSLPLALLRPLGWGSSVISPLIGKHHGITLDHHSSTISIEFLSEDVALVAVVCSRAFFSCRYWRLTVG